MPVPEPELFTALKRVRSSSRQLSPERSRRHRHRGGACEKWAPVFQGGNVTKTWSLERFPADQPFIRTVNVIGKRSSVLPDLTDQDREKLGVLLVDRREMLR